MPAPLHEGPWLLIRGTLLSVVSWLRLAASSFSPLFFCLSSYPAAGNTADALLGGERTGGGAGMGGVEQAMMEER